LNAFILDFFMKNIALTLICFCLFFQVGHSQSNEKNLILENLIPSLSSDRFLANTEAKKNGRTIPAESLKDKRNWDQNQFSIEIKKDSIRWKISDLEGENFYISYPNDYSLFYGKDKKVLQDELIEGLKTNQLPQEGAPLMGLTLDSLALLILQKTPTQESNSDVDSDEKEKFVADSLLNFFKFPNEQHLPIVFNLSFHKYGNSAEDFVVDQKKFLNAILQNETWEIWGASKDDFVMLLFEHPYLNFQHMLALNLDFERGIINGNFYSFIPNTNFVELSSNYKDKEKLFKLNIDN
jgi:hypothetical protein